MLDVTMFVLWGAVFIFATGIIGACYEVSANEADKKKKD